MKNDPGKDIDDALRPFASLIGAWRVTGEATGKVSYRWAEGGYFLLQEFDIVHGGRTIRGVELIGRSRGFDGTISDDVRSRVYSFLDGLTLDYVYEMEGGELTIWGGERGSPSFYRGTLSADGRTLRGGWQWPGGGYNTTTERIDGDT